MCSLFCHSCDVSFGSNTDSFVDHMTDTHVDEKVCCANCGDILSCGFEYASHYLECHYTNDSTAGDHKERGRKSPVSRCNAPSFGSMEPNLLDTSSRVTSQDGGAKPADPASMDESASGSGRQVYSCFVCGAEADTEIGLQVHVNDCLDSQDSASTSIKCFICGRALDSQAELERHVGECLDSQKEGTSLDVDADHDLAVQLQQEETSAKENQQFRQLTIACGMDDRGSYKTQGRTALDRSYYRGEIDLEQYFMELHKLGLQESQGIEDPGLPLSGILEAIATTSAKDPHVEEIKLCSDVEHCGSQPADSGFGCGYRNIQMVMTGMKHIESYRRALWEDGTTHLPSVPKLQALIEEAWRKGFDAVGAAQLGNRLKGTRKWIGATELAAFLASFRIKSRVIDFHRPTGPNNSHPELFKWAWNYFSSASPALPLYIQHQGHSRTLVGVEKSRAGFRLIILDPSHRRGRLQELLVISSTNVAGAQVSKALQFLRKTEGEMKSRQYQIVVPEGLLNEQEYEAAKQNPTVEKIP